MYRWILMLGVVASLASPSVAQDLDLPGRHYAVLIGINDYTYFSDLTFCDDDIAKLNSTLVQAGFDHRNVVVLRDGAQDKHLFPFRNNIVTQLKNVLESVQSNDLVLVAFSGHGVHLANKSYLCPMDAQLDRPDETMIPLDQVYELLHNCAAGQKLLIVDACRNDPTPSGTRSPAGIQQTNEFTRSLQQQRPPQGTALFNSCAPNQYSVEDPEFRSGVFMHYVITGLHGAADTDQDGKVSLFELYRYAEYETKTHVRTTRNLVQTPVLKGELTGVYEISVVKPVGGEPFAPNSPGGLPGGKERSAADLPVAGEEKLPPLFVQGDNFFKQADFDGAIRAYTAAVQTLADPDLVKAAYLRRSAAYLGKDSAGLISEALTDYLAAGKEAMPVVISRQGTLKLKSGPVATVTPGQIVTISQLNGDWMWVESVNGNEATKGWLDKAHVEASAAAAPRPVVAQGQVATTNTRSVQSNNSGNGNNSSNNYDDLTLGERLKLKEIELKEREYDRAARQGAGPLKLWSLERDIDNRSRQFEKQYNTRRGR